MPNNIERLTFHNIIYGWNSLTTPEKAKLLYSLEEKCRKLSIQWEDALNKFLTQEGDWENQDNFTKLELITKILERAYSIRTKFSIDPDFKKILKIVSEHNSKAKK